MVNTYIEVRNIKEGCQKVLDSGGAPIKPLLKKLWGTMLSNHQKVVGHMPLDPTYVDTPVLNKLVLFIGVKIGLEKCHLVSDRHLAEKI